MPKNRGDRKIDTSIIFALITIAVYLFAIFANHRLTLWREYRKNLADSHADFRRAFADAVFSLTESDVPSSQVVYAFRLQHFAAIQSFRVKVPWFKRFGFDKATKNYRISCDKCIEGGSLAIASSESTDYAKANRNLLLESIEGLLSYAKEV